MTACWTQLLGEVGSNSGISLSAIWQDLASRDLARPWLVPGWGPAVLCGVFPPVECFRPVDTRNAVHVGPPQVRELLNWKRLHNLSITNDTFHRWENQGPKKRMTHLRPHVWLEKWELAQESVRVWSCFPLLPGVSGDSGAAAIHSVTFFRKKVRRRSPWNNTSFLLC